MKRLSLFFLFAALACAQNNINGGGNNVNSPIVPPYATLAALQSSHPTCDITLATVASAPAGQQLYTCSGNGVWTAQASATFSGSLSGDVTGTQAATVVGKINGTSLSALGNGLLTNTTGTGIPTITTLPLAQVNLSPVTFVAGTGGAMAGPQAFYVCTTTCTVTPPTPAAGYQFCVRNAPGVSTVITLAAISGVQYEKSDASGYGTAATAVTSGGVIGDKICIVGLDTAHYLTYSYVGTWTVN